MTSTFTLGSSVASISTPRYMLSGAFLDAAAHNLSDGHAGDTEVIEGFLQRFKLGKLY